jgi:hypothetical protein
MTTQKCAATTRSGDPCQLPAGWGTDHVERGRCKLHGGATPSGESHGAYEHGGFAQQLDNGETVEAFTEAADATDLDPVLMRLAGEAFSRYQRSDDARHLAECRRCLEDACGGDTPLSEVEVVAEVN